MRTPIAVTLASLLAAAASDLPARADAVCEPPDVCPEGGIPESCHGGPYCAPGNCSAAGVCASGKVCVERTACIGLINCDSGREADGEHYEYETLEGSCSSDGKCATGACETRKLCIPFAAEPVPADVTEDDTDSDTADGSPPATKKDSSKGGCHGALPGAATVLGLLVALALAFTRKDVGS